MTDIEARREARRRKILENSGSRLQKITGVQERNATFDIDGYKSTQINGEILTDHSITSRPQLQEQFNHFAGLPGINPSLAPTTTSKPTEFEYFKNYRTAIVILLATCVNILSSLSAVYNLHFVNKIFIPLLCFEAVWLFCNREVNDNSLSKYMILFTSNRRPQLVWILKYLAIIKSSFKDIVIYFFVFVCIFYIRTISIGS